MDIYTKTNNLSNENIIGNDFRKRLIYNGPPETRSVEGMFNLLSNRMGLEYAIIWAFDECDVRLLSYITNPSRKVIIKAISLDRSLYHKYKDFLKEDDLINIVKTSSSSLWSRPGWDLLHELDPQPENVIIAAISYDVYAIKAVKNKTPEICNYLLLNRRLHEHLLDDLFRPLIYSVPNFEPKAFNDYVLEGVVKHNWSLKYLIPELITYELALIVLTRDNNDNLRYITNKCPNLIDENLIQISLSGNNSWVSNFRYVPDKMQTLEMCRKYVKININNLCFVSNNYILQDVMDKHPSILKEDWNILKQKNVTPLIAKLICFFSKSTRKKRFNIVSTLNEIEILELLDYCPYAYQRLLPKQHTNKISTKAVAVCAWNIQNVPTEFYTDELFQMALTLEPKCMKHKR